MTSFRTLIREKPLFLFLLPVFFVLHAYQFYYGFVPVAGLLRITFTYILVAAVLYLLTRLVIRDGVKAALLSFLLLVIALYWGDILLEVKKYLPGAFLSRIPVLFATTIIIAVLLYFLFARLKAQTQKRVVFLLNILFAIYLLTDAGIIVSKAGKDYTMPPLQGAKANTSPAAKPNVYFLLFDEYASSTSLLQHLGYDNSALDSFLLRKGFSIQHRSRSNYNFTYFSMASMLQMSYLTKVDNPESVDLRDYNRCASWIKDNAAVKAWKQAGYHFYNYTFFEIDGQQPLIDDGFLTVKSKLITANTLYDRFMHDYLQFFRSAAANKEATDAAYFRFDDYNNDIVRRLQALAAARDNTPRFVYAHFAVPHSPFYYNAAGNRMPADSAIAMSVAVNPQYYWYNVQRANKDICQIVDAVRSRDTSAVIVLMGDHGFRGEIKDNDAGAKFSNLNAVYFPDGDYNRLYDSVSNVNMFRILLNKLTGSSYPMLPDSSITLHDNDATHDMK